MRASSKWLVTALVAALGGFGTASAQPPPSTEPDYPRGRISGYLFGDIYYNVTGDPEHRYSSSGADSAVVNIENADPPRVIGRDLNGVQIRRIYFQLDNDLSDRFSTRFRLEADSKAFTSDGKIGVYVKNAYLQAKNVIPEGDFFFGMANTPTWETSEEYWGYRSIEKTIADFRGIASSSDLGVALKGFVDTAHRLGYSGMIGTGTFQRPENNRHKRGYLALPIRPIEAFVLEPYADYEGLPGEADRITYKLFAGYEFRGATIGAEVLDRIQHRVPGPSDAFDLPRTVEPFGISVFGRGKLGSRLGAFARYDRWQPDTRADDRIDSDLYIAGLDWTPHPDVHIMPNIEATQYRARGAAVAPPHHDLQARITFYYRWSKP